jgi:hypothetical protein
MQCPIKTTTPLGALSIKDCAIQTVNVCDKKSDRSYLLRGFEYSMPGKAEKKKNIEGETEIVRKVMPINLETSDSVWFNDTVEVLSACPQHIGWLPHKAQAYASAFPLIIIGQNFRDTKRVRCEWSAAPGGGSSKSFETTTAATFISRTRVSCAIPVYPFSIIGPGRRTAEYPSVNSTTFRVRVANADRMSERWATVHMLHQNETVSSTASKAAACAVRQPMLEDKREGETGWFALRGLSQAHLSIDLRLVPKGMMYKNDYLLAIYVTPSLCKEYACDANRKETSFEVSPCKRPIPFSPWFEDSKTMKNDILNFTMTALEDLLFRVEIHILNGLYVTAAPFFLRTGSVRLQAPKRAKVTIGLSDTPMRPFDKGISSEEKAEVVDDYQFITYWNRQLLETTTIAPLNLPPR